MTLLPAVLPMSTTSVMLDLVDPVGPGGWLGAGGMHGALAIVFGRSMRQIPDLPAVAATARLPLWSEAATR
jgi:hypothetical protein